ncbi:MAG: FecR domain-containing protein [Saprospiraceae bacterium]|nr:FecR domain-containing protein [Saprospiraceae bacterium]
MQSVEKPSNSSALDSKRSFNRFLAVVITLMLVTGAISVWDNWGGDAIETTGPGEQKMLELPDGIKITLNPNSEVRFQKGATHKPVFQGSATVTAGSKKVIIETLQLVVNAKNARFEILTNEGESYVKVIQGSVDLILKPSKEQFITLLSGEDYRH